MSDLRNVSFLSTAHADGLRALSKEPDFAGAAGINGTLSAQDVATYLATVATAQGAGRSYVFALTRGAELLGVCRLIGVLGVPRLIVAIGSAYRGQGNGSFIVGHVLQFAFEELKLERVTAGGACLNLLANYGRLDGNGLTRQEWQAARSQAPSPAL